MKYTLLIDKVDLEYITKTIGVSKKITIFEIKKMDNKVTFVIVKKNLE